MDVPVLSPARRALERRRLAWALLYLPWSAGVFLPVAVGSMLGLGSLAVLVSLVSPDAAWWVGVSWSRLVCWANLTRVELRGVEHCRPGQSYVYMLNHNSNFDVVAFYGSWRSPFRWVLKEELRKIPGLGWYCAAGGHVFLDRSNHERAVASLAHARERMAREGFSIAFFPEGTRSRLGRLQPFKKGGFVLAQELGLPILPISVSGSNAVLPGKTLRLLPGRIVLTVHPELDTRAYGEDRERLMADTRAAIAGGLSPWEQGDSEP